MMGYSLPGEETAKFQAYSSIDQSYWNSKLAATEKLPIFDDGDNEELEHDVRTGHRDLLSYVTIDWETLW